MKQISNQDLEEYKKTKYTEDYEDPEDPNEPDKVEEEYKQLYIKNFKKSNDEALKIFSDIQLRLKILTKASFKSIFKEKTEDDEDELVIDIAINKDKLNLNYEKCIDLIDGSFSFIISFGPFGPFSLAISFIVSAKAGICLELGIDLNWEKKEYSFSIDINGKLIPSLSLDFGVYYPSPFSTFRMSLNLGINGILVSITAGVKLNLFLKGSKYEIDLYYEFKAYEISFYVLFRIEFEIKLFSIKISFSIKIEIFKKVIIGLKYKYEKKRFYKYFENQEFKKLRETEKGWIFI